MQMHFAGVVTRNLGILLTVGMVVPFLPAKATLPHDSSNVSVRRESISSDIWDSEGITRRRALRTLGGQAAKSWNLPQLLAPLPSLTPGNNAGALINVLTGLDPKSLERPSRMTEFLLMKAESSDPETRRWAVYGLGLLLESRFSLDTYRSSRGMLLRALKDTDPVMRHRAAEAFGRFSPLQVRKGSQPLVTGMEEVGQALVATSGDDTPAVRQESLKALKHLLLLGPNSGVNTPAVAIGRLITIGRQRLEDPDSKVRSAALKLLAFITDGRGLPADSIKLIYTDTLQRLEDTNTDVVATATFILYGIESHGWPNHARVSSDIASLVSANRLTPVQLSTLLSARRSNLSDGGYALGIWYLSGSSHLNDSKAGMVLLLHLSKAADLGTRINATRLLMGSESFRKEHAINGHSEAIALYREGLASSNLTEQLDGIAGLAELDGIDSNQPQRIVRKSDLLNVLEPGLISPLPPVRWATAFALSEIDPENSEILPSFGELLRMVEDHDIRAKALWVLSESNNPLAADIISRSIQKENLGLFYVRSCNAGWYGYPAGQTRVIVQGIVRSECRQVLTEFLSADPDEMRDTVFSLLSILQTGNTDQRFNAAYALGQLQSPFEDFPGPQEGLTSALQQQIINVLRSLVDNRSEDSEIRRIAATMLLRQGLIKASFFDHNNLYLPTRQCPYPNMARTEGPAGTPGFRFDAYEGRCLYDTRTGCGDGLRSIYLRLRQLFGSGS